MVSFIWLISRRIRHENSRTTLLKRQICLDFERKNLSILTFSFLLGRNGKTKVSYYCPFKWPYNLLACVYYVCTCRSTKPLLLNAYLRDYGYLPLLSLSLSSFCVAGKDYLQYIGGPNYKLLFTVQCNAVFYTFLFNVY